jgi:hypothetical protein
VEDLFIRWLQRSIRAAWDELPVRIRTGFILRPISMLRSLGWILLVWCPTALWLLVTGLNELRNDAHARWVALAMGLVAAAAGVSLLIRSNRSLIFYNDRGLVFRSTFGPFRRVLWARIGQLEYQRTQYRLAFHSNRAVLVFGLYFRGFAAFHRKAQLSLPHAIWAAPFSQLADDLSKYPWSHY